MAKEKHETQILRTILCTSIHLRPISIRKFLEFVSFSLLLDMIQLTDESLDLDETLFHLKTQLLLFVVGRVI
jgi:hypothetical protein